MSYPNMKHVMGHQLVEKPWDSVQGYCERCNGLIMGIVQSWLRCEGRFNQIRNACNA